MLKIILLASVILYVGLSSCSVEEESTSDFVSDRGSWPLDPGYIFMRKNTNDLFRYV